MLPNDEIRRVIAEKDTKKEIQALNPVGKVVKSGYFWI